MQKYGLAKKGVKAGGYDLGPTILKAGPGRAPGLHDRPAAVPAGLAPAPAALLLQVLVGARGPVGHEHGHPVRDEGQREAVPDDEDALRGQLEQAEVPGHAARLSGAGGHRRLPATPQRAGFGRRVAAALIRRREASISLVLLGLVVYFSLRTEAFFGSDNARVIAEFSAPIAIIAAGEVMLLICGEIDLSVGMVYAFSTWIFYFATSPTGACRSGSRSIVGLLSALARRARQRADHRRASVSPRSSPPSGWPTS